MEVTLAQMLDARERRWMIQQRLLSQRPSALICFTMNVAGPVKTSDLLTWGFEEGLRLIRLQLEKSRICITAYEELREITGCEAFFAVDQEAVAVKALMSIIEDETPCGRLFDIDVLTPAGNKIERTEVGREPRRCLLCDKPAAVCGSRRLHTVAELQQKTAKILMEAQNRFFAEKVASLAVRSLLYEVLATPKPGLVDRCNSGAHSDMDIFTFADSITALIPYFSCCVNTGIETAAQSPDVTLDRIVLPGREAEQRMTEATGGINTHKGAVYSMGILCAAVGRIYAHTGEITPETVFETCSTMARPSTEVFFQKRSENAVCETAGEQLYRMAHIRGIRGEVADGFPSVRGVSLPALEKALEAGCSVNDAGIYALLALMAAVTDTNMIHRSDAETAEKRRAEAAACLPEDPKDAPKAAAQLDADYIAHHLSPGGCADLLAVTWMMHFLKT